MKSRMLLSLLIVLALVNTPPQVAIAGPTADTWYVDQTASGLDDCTSWTNACQDLQKALGKASSGDQIYVAQGSYKPGANRSDTFQLVSGVQIYGGFPSGGGVAAKRDWQVYETTLTGDIGTPDVTSDNVYHVVTSSGVSGTTILDGFIITEGCADGTGGAGTDRGAGVYNVTGNPQLINILITDNYALNGAGMGNVSNGNATLNYVIFKRNMAVNFGGGMDNIESEPTLFQVDFFGNQADYGGGMRNFYDNVSAGIWMINAVFVGNTATYHGGAIYNDEAKSSILNGDVIFNTAGAAGGGIYSTYLSDAYLYNSVLWGNQAPTDPQVYTSANSTATIQYSLVQGGCPTGGSCTPTPLTSDPDFMRDPEDGADDTWGSVDDDYGDLRLRQTSPAIDAGDVEAVTGITTAVTVNSDHAGNPRRVDVVSVTDSGNGSPPIVDIGAYEHPPEVIYVDASATGGDNSGLSWADALLSLYTALRWGHSGAAQVWMAEGTYKPGGNRWNTFQLVNNLEIYGGFPAGGGDGTFSARDPNCILTILSGDIGAIGDPSDNSYHVVEASGVDRTARLDGLAIRYGQGDGDEYRFHYGGGIYNWGGSPTLVDIDIQYNYADYGGGMHNRQGDPLIENSKIELNQAKRGAGLHNRVSDYVMSETTVGYNIASGGDGGGIYNDASDPTISDSELINNQAKNGGGMYNEDGSVVKLKNVRFQRNYAATGGGIYNYQSTLKVWNAKFYGNGAKSDCGGILNLDGEIDLANSVFSGNYAPIVGGICNSTKSIATLWNVTMSGNSSTSGVSSGFGNRSASSAILVNTIVWGNKLGDFANIDADCYAAISYSILPSCPTLSTCSNLITDDPEFIRVPDPGLDGEWGTSDDDYGDLRLASSSPGVDAGDNILVPKDILDLDGDANVTEKTPLDLDNNARFMDVGVAADTGNGAPPIVDVGAYEAFNYNFLPLVVRN